MPFVTIMMNQLQHRAILFLLLLICRNSLTIPTLAVPFGYQSDSSKSFEYSQNGDELSDPSSFVGSVHYDARHHALFITGATFSDIFDGVDAYKVTEEKNQLEDSNPKNDGFWWNDMQTGLHPHMGDPGIPGYSPYKESDCFYSVMALPVDNTDMAEVRSEPKLVHSRRFGTETILEACSAVDILFSDEMDPGQFTYGFEEPTFTGDDFPSNSPSSSTYNPTASQPPSSATYNPTETNWPSQSPSSATYNPTASQPPSSATYNPTETNWPSQSPSSATYNPTASQPPSSATYNPTEFKEGFGGFDFFGPSSATYNPTASQPPSQPPSSATYNPTEFKEGFGGFDFFGPSSATYNPTASQPPSSATYNPTESNEGVGGFFGGRRNRYRSLQFETRSVRLLMAGHVESPNGQDGYTVDLLPANVKREGTHVYAFAQQVDVRLPAGVRKMFEMVEEDMGDDMVDMESVYNLHENADAFEPSGPDDDTWATDPEADDIWANAAFDPEAVDPSLTAAPGKQSPDFQQLMNDLSGKSVEKIQEEFAGIVTSGVDARALLDDQLPTYLNAIYPVSLVSDPTTKKHYYVASLASRKVDENDQVNNYGLHVDPTIGEGSSQKFWTDFVNIGNEQDANDHFGGPNGRPNYGSDYLVVLKKVIIESVNAACVGTNGWVSNCGENYSNTEQILSSKGYNEQNIAMRQEWYQEYEPEEGVDVRPSGLLFAPGGDPTGQGDMLIMVGTTAGFGNAFGTNGGNDEYETQDNSGGRDLDGFIMKIRTDTGEFAGHSKFDAVSSTFINMHSHRIQSLPLKDDTVAGLCSKPLQLSGQQEIMKHVFLVGTTESKLPGIATGLRDDNFLSNHPVPDGMKSMEAFLMKMDLATLEVIWTVQLGAIYSDGVDTKGSAFGFGCAVTPDGDDIYLTGLVSSGGLVTDFSTEDSKGIPSTAHGGTDVFIASYKTLDGSRNFVRQIGSTRDDFPSRSNGGITADRLGNAILTGHTRGSIVRKRDSAEYKYGVNGAYAAADIFVMSFDRETGNHIDIVDDGVPPPNDLNSQGQNSERTNKEDAAVIGVVAITLCFVVAAIAGLGIVAYKIRSGRKRREERIFVSTNLRERSPRGDKRSMRRRSTWGMRRQSSALSTLQDLNVMVEVRNSASGGWHGIYDDEQLQVIDFGMSSAGYKDNVVEQSLFMEDDLKEIEEASIDNYEIGNIDDVSDEDLIKAYNDAMAVDIEPENDQLFTMAGLGSPVLDHDHQIT